MEFSRGRLISGKLERLILNIFLGVKTYLGVRPALNEGSGGGGGGRGGILNAR